MQVVNNKRFNVGILFIIVLNCVNIDSFLNIISFNQKELLRFGSRIKNLYA